jgi:hypothetical protein
MYFHSPPPCGVEPVINETTGYIIGVVKDGIATPCRCRCSLPTLPASRHTFETPDDEDSLWITVWKTGFKFIVLFPREFIRNAMKID